MRPLRLLPWLLPAVAGLVALAPVLIALPLDVPGRTLFIDWLTYALGTDRVLAGQSLYLDAQLAGPYRLPDVTPGGYIYPPPSAVLFLPFAMPGIGLVAWLAFNVGLFFAGLVAVLRRELGAVRPIPLAIALIGLSVVLPLPGGVVIAPFTSGVGHGNVNVALAGLLGLCWAAGSRRGWIPVAAGVGAAFKLFPAALAAWAMRTHGWRALLVAGGVAAGVALVSLPLAGPGEWQRFLGALANAQPACDSGRTSVACVALPVVGVSAAKLLGVVVGGALLAASLVIRADYPAFVLLALGMLAPLADGHQHYLLFVYMLLVIGIARLWAARILRKRDETPAMATGRAT